MDNYKILEAIGEGSFGRVFRGHSLKTGETVALKFIPKRNKVNRELKSLRRECEIQQDLFHPNIVRMVDAFETDREVVAVSEYVPIQLYSLLEKYGALPEDRVQSIACNLISAIYYLHSLRILHRDIKPQNILLTVDGEAKLCDFGFSRKMGINTYVLTSIKGTPLYMAPELIDESPYDHTADIWSLGCILFELLTGKPPFCTTSIVQLIKMVHFESIKWPNNISEECRSFLGGLLQKEPSKRLTWPALLKHSWVEDGVVVLVNPIHPSALTHPLSSSQEHIKELQKKQLIQQTLSQPKILKNFIKPCYSSLKYRKQFDLTPNYFTNFAPECIPQNLNKLIVNTDTIKQAEEEKTTLEKEILSQDPVIQPFEPFLNNLCLSPDADVRAAVGSSVRKLSSISQESGFKEDDVADISSLKNKCEERKDSMANYLVNSVDSSYRGSRPSFPLLDINNVTNANLPNINEESNGNISAIRNDDHFDNISGNTIESEEWVRFLDKTLIEVLNGHYDIYKEHTELAMFISPLQNPTCQLVVAEKIVTLLLSPFAIKEIDTELFTIICNVYLRCKVVPNLVYYCKSILNSKLSINKPVTNYEIDDEMAKTLKSILTLICYLLYKEKNFIVQFCDAVCIFSTYKCLGKLLQCNNIHKDIPEKLLAILSQILRYSYETASIIEQIMPQSSHISLLFETYLNHKSSDVRSSVCTFIGYSVAAKCSYISCLENQHQILCDLINMENDSVQEVQKAASFAVSCIQTFTTLISETDN